MSLPVGNMGVLELSSNTWRWIELHIFIPPIAIFYISLVEPPAFRWNSVCFWIKLDFFHILCTNQDFVQI
jgi:hypothetical protein